MSEDREQAWQSYLAFCHACGNHSFPEALDTAGLDNPFAPDSLGKLMNWLQTRL